MPPHRLKHRLSFLMPDPSDLAALHAACFTSPRPWSAAEFDSLLQSPHVFLLVESGGFLLGRAIAGEAELLTLAVAPDHRRKGIGLRLVMRFLTECRNRAADRAFLEVAADNVAAVGLYQTAGFAAEGRRKAYYQRADGTAVDALVLAHTLTDPGSTRQSSPEI